MTFVEALKRINTESMVDALYWLFHTFFGGLLPVIIAFLLLKAFSREFSLVEFAQSGEIILFSASTLSASYYTVNRKSNRLLWAYNRLKNIDDSNTRSFPGARGLGTLIYFLTVLAAVIFASSLVSEIPNTGLEFDREFATKLAIIIFFSSIFLGILVTLIENSWTDVADEVTELFEQPVNKLGSKFDKLGAKKKSGR